MQNFYNYVDILPILLNQKKTKWSIIQNFFYKKNLFLNKKFKNINFCLWLNFFKYYLSLYSLKGNNGFSLNFLKFFLAIFKILFYSDSFILFHNLLLKLRLPFVFRSLKIAGKSYEIPMIVSVLSQYKFIFRIFFKIMKYKKTFNFSAFYFDFILKAILNQSFLIEIYEKNIEIAATNQRFLRFRW